MKGEAQMTVPEVALVLGTRAALGVGLGLMLSGCFSSEEARRAVGSTLLLAGAFSGAVLAYELFGRPRTFTLSFGQAADGRGTPAEPRESLERPDALAQA
jgi:hypothetical protein